jgi:hypothetical protein
LQDIRETAKGTDGLHLFPTLLKGEFHGVMSMIEADSKNGRVEELQGELVGGIGINRLRVWKHRFRVTDRKGVHGQYEMTSFE